MNFYLIKSVDEEGDNISGVIIESKEGTLGARLSGENGTSDPARVVPALLERMPQGGFPVARMRGGSRISVRYRPGEPGFPEALMRNLQPPLKYYLHGSLTDQAIDTPQEMTRRLWRMFTTDDEVRDNPPNYARIT